MSKKLMREILSGTGPQTRTPTVCNNNNYHRTSSMHSKNERIPVTLPQNPPSIEHSPSYSGVALIAQKKKEEELLRGARIRSIHRIFEEDFKKLQEVHEIEHAELDKKQQLELERLKHDRDIRINSIIRDSQYSITHMFNTIGNMQSDYITSIPTTEANSSTPIISNTINLQQQQYIFKNHQPSFCSADKPRSQSSHPESDHQYSQQIKWKGDPIAATTTHAKKRSLSAAVHPLPNTLKYDDLSDDDSVNEIFDFVDQLQNFNTITKSNIKSNDSNNFNHSNLYSSAQSSFIRSAQLEAKNLSTNKNLRTPKKSILTEQKSSINSTTSNRQIRSQSLNVSWNNKENQGLKGQQKKIQQNENSDMNSSSNNTKGQQLQKLLSKQVRQPQQPIQHPFKYQQQSCDEKNIITTQRQPFQEIGNKLTNQQQQQIQQSKKEWSKQFQMGMLENQQLTSMQSIWERLQQVNQKSRRTQQHLNTQQAQSSSLQNLSLEVSLPSSLIDSQSIRSKYYPETTKAPAALDTAKNMKIIFEKSGSLGSTISNDHSLLTKNLIRNRNNDYYGGTVAVNRVDTYSSSCSQNTCNDRALSLQLWSTDLEEY